MSDEQHSTSVRQLAAGFKGLDTSGVEVDEEQEPPLHEVGSPGEDEALAKMEALVVEGGDAKAIAADKFTKLLCLRGRKYDPEAGAKVLSKLLALKEELGIGDPAHTEQITKDMQSKKLIATGAKDPAGRVIMWLRLRYHNPKESKPVDMARMVTTIMLDALKDPDAQRCGLVMLGDLNGIGLKNIDPGVPKMLMGKVFPCLPIRIGRFCIFNPPWIFGHILLPIVLALMSKKLRGRIVLINGHHPEKLLPYIPKDSLPAALDGNLAIDEDKKQADLIATLQK